VAGASASALGDGSPATGAGSGDEGAGSHLSGRTCPYLLPPLPPLPRPTTSTPLSLTRRVPAARVAETSCSSAPGAPIAACCTPSCDPPAPALAVAPRAQACGTEAWVGRTSRHSRAPSAGVRRNLKTRRQPKKPAEQEGKSRNPLTNWPTGSISSTHRDASSQRPGLRSMARRARVAAYHRVKGSRSSRDSANATGSASSLISKMWSRLSIRGAIRRWWRFARTHPAVSPRSASFFNAATSESSRTWCEGGDTPWYHEAALSLSTLPV
jgi:hypothetical protein